LLREADRTFLKPGKHGSEPSAKAMDEGWRCELRRRCEISEAVPSASIANDVVRPPSPDGAVGCRARWRAAFAEANRSNYFDGCPRCRCPATSSFLASWFRNLF
jgi:hypothetical protein